MNAVRLASLAGFARPMPDVLTFAVPVFLSDAGSLVTQVIVDGKVVAFDDFAVGEDFVSCALGLSTRVGGFAMACFEVRPDAFLVGNAASLGPVVQGLTGRPGAGFCDATVNAVQRFLDSLPSCCRASETALVLLVQLCEGSPPRVVSVEPGISLRWLTEGAQVATLGPGRKMASDRDLAGPSRNAAAECEVHFVQREKPRVLLVDCDEVHLILTGTALRACGFEVVEAISCERGLDLLQQFVPDIVVLDASVLGLDGFDLCPALRWLLGSDNVPVLMLVGLGDDASIDRAHQAGATDFFVKSTPWSLLTGRLHDLLRSARTRQDLERSKAKLARAQDLARMGSFDWRPGPAERVFGQLVMSPEGLRVFALNTDQQVSLRALLRRVVPGERSEVLRLLAQAMRLSTVLTTDTRVKLIDGRERILHVEAEPEFNEHGHSIGYTGIVQDVTDRRVAEDRIRQLANYDALTGLPNRRHLMWRTERALDHARRRQHRFALLLIDLDRFKVINDTLGHAAGDELLVEASRRLRMCVRHTDQPYDGVLDAAGSRSHRSLEAVGRLGDDEFLALLPEVPDESDAVRVANAMLEALRERVGVSGQARFVTASVAIAMYPRDGQSVADLLRKASMAMHSAKSGGGNNVSVYDPQQAQ